MSKLGIKTKLLGTISLLSILIIAVGLISSIASKAVEKDYQSIVAGDVEKLKIASDMYIAYQTVRIELRTLGLPNLSESEQKAAIEKTMAAIKAVESADKSYLALGFAPGQEAVHTDLMRAWADFKQVGVRVLKLHEEKTEESREKIIAIFLKDCPETAGVVREAMDALNDFHEKEIANQAVKAETTSKNANVASWSVILLSVFASLGLGFYVSLSTARELKAITSHLASSSGEISSAATDLHEASAALSTSASGQASSIQQAAASIDQIRAMVERNSENSRASAELSAKSRSEAVAGRETVHEMISAVNEINQSNRTIKRQIDDSNQRFEEVVQIFEEIRSKTKVINDIVFQTKLLSFNASVEAARAGEHGKGFSVVAEEVGNLAAMSGSAASDISQLLETSSSKVKAIVNQSTSEVAVLMASAEQKVARGNALASECGDVLERIVQKADHLSEMVSSISAASQEQSSGVAEIAQAMRNLDDATQVNMAQTHQTAASASGLGDQVHVLNDSSFRLRILVDGENTLKHAA